MKWMRYIDEASGESASKAQAPRNRARARILNEPASSRRKRVAALAPNGDARTRWLPSLVRPPTDPSHATIGSIPAREVRPPNDLPTMSLHPLDDRHASAIQGHVADA